MNTSTLGASAFTAFEGGFADFCGVLRRLGLTRVELRNFIGDDEGVDPAAFPAVREVLSSWDLKSTIHAPWRRNLAAEDRQERGAAVEQYRRVTQLAHELGSDVVVFHGGWHADRAVGRAIALESTADLLQEARDLGVQLALENEEASRPTLFQHPDDFREVDIEGLGFVFDVAHAHTFGHTARDFLPIIGSRLVEVHLHDNLGGRDEHLAIGEGSIDWDDFLEVLDEYDDGHVVPVIESKTIANLEKSVAALAKLVERVSTTRASRRGVVRERDAL
jgi:sugar phosphate isomerase/epimerase